MQEHRVIWGRGGSNAGTSVRVDKRDRTKNFSGKSNYHTVTTTTNPLRHFALKKKTHYDRLFQIIFFLALNNLILFAKQKSDWIVANTNLQINKKSIKRTVLYK